MSAAARGAAGALAVQERNQREGRRRLSLPPGATLPTENYLPRYVTRRDLARNAKEPKP